ncbi:probable G-protein coupled receptor 139 [Heptranchias perlo]|uniref:probable G-protein coupled receptor 139 n=1 Tax=Heptranchias perlo TaxID=212740 RepID=UPI00355A199A
MMDHREGILELDLAEGTAAKRSLKCISSKCLPELRFSDQQKSLLLTEMGYPLMLQIERVYYPVLAVIGVPVNLVAIVILSRGKCGLSKCVTRYLVGMAAADLLVVITDVILKRVVEIYFPVSFLTITPVCRLFATMKFAVMAASVWFTVVFTFDRFVAICCQKLKTKYCTEKTAAAVIGVVSALSCLLNSPWYFVFVPEYIMDNVARGCVMKSTLFTSPAWAAFDLFNLALTPCLPFILILLFNVLTARHILAASRVRRGLRGRSNVENHKDAEMENRRKSIILLFCISGSFILLWSTGVFYVISPHITNSQSYTASDIEPVGFMLQLLSCCTNTCIYAVTQTKFREELKNGLKYPLNVIVTLAKS